MATIALSLLFSTFFVNLARSQAPQDPLNDFCRRYGQQTIVIDDRLYIDGGFVYANPISQNPNAVINTGLLYDDLFTVTGGMPAQHANLSKNSSIPDVAGGVLWADKVNKIFYLYGGEFAGTPQSFQLYGYDVILDQWNSTGPSNTPIERLSYGAGVSSSENGLAFYYGGYMNNRTNPLWNGPQIATSHLLQYDMTTNEFTNSTGIDDVGRAEGTMVFIPASASGMLIYFGGAQYLNETGTPQPMDEILVYDIADAKWYRQTATGDIPGDRRLFCGGATWPDDQSSYNIYIYGGFGFGDNSTGYDDVYILTLPAFEWIKWYPEPGSNATGAPHGSLTCNVVNGTQMIVMGGNFTYTDVCDVPPIQGQHNLILGQNGITNDKWAAYQTNITEYVVPSEIVDVVGGGPEGGATATEPSGGWDDSNMQVYFEQQAQFGARSPTRVIPSATGSPSDDDDSSSHAGAIAGGVIGGVVGLALIAGLVWWFLIRPRRRQVQEIPKTSQPSSAVYPNTPSPPYSATADPKYHHPVGPDPGVHEAPSPNPAPFAHAATFDSQSGSYHPAHAPSPGQQQAMVDPNAPIPMSYAQHEQNAAFYPPPEPGRPEPPREVPQEMSAIRSPNPESHIAQPTPMKGGMI